MEIPGNGTALLYQLSDEVVPHSEVVELISRDRDSQSLVVSSTTLSRFSDYVIDYLSGDIRFTRAIATQDSDLNPQFVRIGYDRRGDGKDYVVAGIRAEHKLNDALSVGASYTEDQHEEVGGKVGGGYVEYQPHSGTRLIVSVATTKPESNDSDGGNAVLAKDRTQLA